ncbi:MAG: branched-chain amino acid ABC transporter permease [Candidatus Dormibacteria bacterium]
MLLYSLTAAVFAGLEIMLALGLNLQYGLTGMFNLSYIMYMAFGAYMTAVLVLPPAKAPFSFYILGSQLPFPVALLGAMLVAGVVAALVGVIIVGRRVRAEYFLIVSLVIASEAAQLIAQDRSLFNGFDGLFGVAAPFPQNFTSLETGLAFVALVVVGAGATLLVAEVIRRSGYGRMLRAIRDDEVAALAFGVNVFRARLTIYVVGAVIAAAAGSITMVYVGAFSTAGWTVGETILALTCVIAGGSGNNWGTTIASVLLVGLIIDIVMQLLIPLLPGMGANPSIVALSQVIVANLLLLAVLRWRPQGLFPERVRRMANVAGGAPMDERGRGSQS